MLPCQPGWNALLLKITQNNQGVGILRSDPQCRRFRIWKVVQCDSAPKAGSVLEIAPGNCCKTRRSWKSKILKIFPADSGRPQMLATNSAHNRLRISGLRVSGRISAFGFLQRPPRAILSLYELVGVFEIGKLELLRIPHQPR
jgi:hypothetical protein